MHRQGGTIIPQTHVQVVCGLYAEDMGERLKAFLATHRMLVIDTMATMLICLLWAITTIPPFLEDGLLLRWDADGWTRIWSILLTLPLRIAPHEAACRRHLVRRHGGGAAGVRAGIPLCGCHGVAHVLFGGGL